MQGMFSAKLKTPRPAGKPGGYDFSLPTAILLAL